MSNILFLNFLDGLNSTNTITFSDVLDGGYSSNVSFDGNIDGENSDERIEKRISSVVSKHIPEYIRTQNPLFVLFLKYYYQYLEQDFQAQEILQDIQSYADIDRTVPSFVYYFLQNYGSKIPTSALIDKKFLVKKLNDLYESKGSQLSFQTLFRLLYQSEITVNYPYEFVLRPSDGEYTSKTCIGVMPVEGSSKNLTNRFLTYTFNGAMFDTPIVNVKNLQRGIVEIEIDGSKKATDYKPGEFVYVYDRYKNVLFKGEILPTIDSVSILTPGSGFKVGQVYSVNYGQTTGSLLKIQKVYSSNKGVEKVKIINFGYDYPSNLEVNIVANENFTKIVEPRTSSTRGITDQVSLFTSNNNVYFSSDYIETLPPQFPQGNYVGSLILQTSVEGNVYDVSNITSSVSSDVCTLLLKTGGLAKYPGTFVSSRGFLSEFDINLQDDLLNQPFAYQLSTDLDINVFYNTVIDLVHPAGFLLFNRRNLNNEIDVSSNVGTSFRETITKLEVFDGVDVSDSSFVSYVYQFNDSVSVLDSNLFVQINDDVVTTTDVSNITLSITINDSVDSIDQLGNTWINLVNVENITTDSEIDTIGRLLSFVDSTNVVDTSNITFNLATISDIVESIDVSNISTTINVSDSVDNLDDNLYQISRSIDDTADALDVSNNQIQFTFIDLTDQQTETIELNQYNPDLAYTNENFFAEDYIENLPVVYSF